MSKIVLKLKGGLGNQMFQYATGLAIAQKNNTEIKLDITAYENIKFTSETPRDFELSDFNISSPLASIEEVKKNKYPFGIISKSFIFLKKRILKIRYLDYHPSYINKKNIKYIEGYFQSEKNFMEVEDKIHKEFTLKTESALFLNYKEKILNSNSTSIHIRRGDYVINTRTHSYHGTCSLNYYKDAVLYIKERVQSSTFYIFSDDIEWVKENLKIENATYVSSPETRNSEELILMSLCNNNIIANSSFSWWGAWLNQNPDKIVVAPKKWVNKVPNPHPNIIPSSWIQI